MRIDRVAKMLGKADFIRFGFLYIKLKIRPGPYKFVFDIQEEQIQIVVLKTIKKPSV